MKNINLVCLGVRSVLFLIVVFSAVSIRASDRPEISGFYDIIETNRSNADEVQVTLRIRLTNLSETSLTITKLELQSFPFMPKAAAAPLSPVAATAAYLFLTAHDSRTVERQFSISRMEYGQWQKGGHPRFLLTIETSASQRISRVVPLFQMKGIKE